MLKVNRKKIKAYGDRLDDGVIQLSFTLPIPASPEAKETAKVYIEKLGLKKVSVLTMESMGDNFSFFVVYGKASHHVDFNKIKVPKIKSKHMEYKELVKYMEKSLDRNIVAVGATIGTDAHTVGIDAIMNMKGYAGDYGLERYPMIDAHNLGSQVTEDRLIEKAAELKADVILISQVVTQRDSHIKNLKAFIKKVKKSGKLKKDVLFIVGGPRLDHAVAVKLGYDAGFGTGTKPSYVASFIVNEYVKKHGVKADDGKKDEVGFNVDKADRSTSPQRTETYSANSRRKHYTSRKGKYSGRYSKNNSSSKNKNSFRNKNEAIKKSDKPSAVAKKNTNEKPSRPSRGGRRQSKGDK